MVYCNGCSDKDCEFRSLVDVKCSRYKPKTNADRIRAMTDEELANKMYDWLSDDCISCPVLKDDCPVWGIGNIRCNDAILEWLKQECES